MTTKALLAGSLVFALMLAPALGEEEHVSAMGVVVPARTATLSARATGVLTELQVGVGDTVATGQPLARLDARDAELALRQAELDLAVQQILVGTGKSRIASDEAELLHATKSVLRVAEGVQAAVAYPSTLEEAQLVEAQARARVEAGRLELRREEILASQCEVRLAAARLALERTRLVAPFDGVVVEVHAAVGESVRRHESPVVTLIDVSRLYVTVKVKDRRACVPGRPVVVKTEIAEDEDVRFEGRVERASPVHDPKTWEVGVRIALDEEATRRLRPGHHVRVRIPVTREEER